MSTASDRPDWRTPWRNARWGFAAVWMIFLGYPIASVITSDASTGAKIASFALIGVFAVVYLFLCVYVMASETVTRGRIIATLVLIAVVAALLPVLHVGALGLAPFLMAAAAFALPPLGQLVTMIGILVATVAIPEVFGWELDLSLVAIVAVVGLILVFSRQISAREREREVAENRQRETRAQLAVVAERERVARDVHDILGHSLTVISVKTELFGRLVDLDPERAKAEAADVNALAREALAEVRATVGGLRTPELPAVLASARSALAAAGIEATLPEPAAACDDDATLSAWVLREAVTNVVRHSCASSCVVELSPGRIVVRDDGRGMRGGRGNGLNGLAERLADAGGRLHIDSGPGGTTVIADLRPADAGDLR
ncbi:MAG: histidine kinase [Gordonia sp. (in: high G+C Gram-positive bacteria)]